MIQSPPPSKCWLPAIWFCPEGSAEIEAHPFRSPNPRDSCPLMYVHLSWRQWSPEMYIPSHLSRGPCLKSYLITYCQWDRLTPLIMSLMPFFTVPSGQHRAIVNARTWPFNSIFNVLLNMILYLYRPRALGPIFIFQSIIFSIIYLYIRPRLIGLYVMLTLYVIRYYACLL